ARSGNEWECVRGYRKLGGACAPVEVPPNGYLDASGHDWACERGYKKRSSCLPVEVPTNAHLDSSGGDWTCDSGYRLEEEGCIRGAGGPLRGGAGDAGR